MTNTNTKAMMAKIQESILNHFDNLDALKSEVNHYFNNFGRSYADTMVQYGCFDCYYSDVANTMAGWFDTTSDRIWEYYKDDSQKLWNSYKSLISRELEHIRTNKKVYI